MFKFILTVVASVLLYSAPPLTGSLSLTVDNIKYGKGRVWVGIYASADEFLDREKARLIEVQIDQAGEVTIPVDSLIFGEDYALAIFHDLNDNGEVDRNFLGLPSEPWAFSGEPKTRLRLPRFDEVKFTFDHETSEHVVRLRKW
ncbi:MAG: DUF2141 domain-containing protein [Bacteroidota bacterium]